MYNGEYNACIPATQCEWVNKNGNFSSNFCKWQLLHQLLIFIPHMARFWIGWWRSQRSVGRDIVVHTTPANIRTEPPVRGRQSQSRGGHYCLLLPYSHTLDQIVILACIGVAPPPYYQTTRVVSDSKG